MIVTNKENRNVLSQTSCNELIDLLDTIANSSVVSRSGKTIKFEDICLRFQNQCFANSHVRMIAQIFAKNQSVYPYLLLIHSL